MPDDDSLSTTIILQPTITMGQVTTVAEKVLGSLFREFADTVDDEMNPIKDPVQFFSMRTTTVKMLTGPIKAVKDTKLPMVLKFEFNMETGIMKMTVSRK